MTTRSLPAAIMSDLAGLRERVAKATGADRELDAAIMAACRVLSPLAQEHRWAREWAGQFAARGDRVHLVEADGELGPHFAAEPYTASIDAALTLVERVLPGWLRIVGEWSTKDAGRVWRAALAEPVGFHVSPPMPFEADAPTAPLAILAALLQALEQTR